MSYIAANGGSVNGFALPGRTDLPPGCTLQDIEREQLDDDEFWSDWHAKHGGTELEDLEER